MKRKSKAYTDEDRNALWEEYRRTGDKAAFTRLSESYMSLLETVAYTRKSGLPKYIEADELINAGFEGLADAISKFDDSGGFKFETYATIRINGAITDSLRSTDKVSRHYRSQFTKMQSAVEAYMREFKEAPTNAQVAEILGWSEEKLSKVMGIFISSGEVSLNAILEDEHSNFQSSTAPIDYLHDTSIIDPIEQLHYEELTEVIIGSLASLTERESRVVYLHVVEGLKFQEIADILGVAQSRANALYQSAVSKISESLDL